jgi:pyruvate ferredoxin oxidoreductase beta subunit
MATDKVLEVCKLAVKTKVYSLFEVIEGKYVMGRKISNPLPVSEYLKIQGRFRHLSEEQIEKMQLDVDRKYDDLIRLSEM